MTSKVLIITNSGDLHADLLIPKLQAQSIPSFRLNLDHFPRDYSLSQSYRNGKVDGEIVHCATKDRILFNEVGAVWLRKPAEYQYLSDLTVQEKAYAKLETDQAMFGWLYSLDCFWMSHPTALRGAMWKAEQLKRAANFGFILPDSLITNQPSQVRSFARTISGELIFKTLSTPQLASEYVDPADIVAQGLPTTLITEDMMQELDAVRELPCQFQEYIPKAYELRVTIIGDQVFAAKIFSQQDVRTKVDSRDMSAEITYAPIVLPTEMNKRCLEFMKSYGLNYSAMDFIVTPEGKYVFLENNPNGQFLYIEQLIPEFKLLDATADTLARKTQCHQN